MLASAGRPSLHGYYACTVYWTKEALRRNRRQKYGKTSFSTFWVFLFSLNSRERFWGLIFWHLWIGRTRHPGPTSLPHHVGIEFLNIGSWLTHGDLALEVQVDFPAVAEHRLIPAGVRSEWSRLRKKGLASVWALACQDYTRLVLSACGVLPFLFLLLLLPSLGDFSTVVVLFVA